MELGSGLVISEQVAREFPHMLNSYIDKHFTADTANIAAEDRDSKDDLFEVKYLSEILIYINHKNTSHAYFNSL